MKLIVTGGSGMVGFAFKQFSLDASYPTREQLCSMLDNPSHKKQFNGKNVVHLAAKVGGIKANEEQMADFYVQNSDLNGRVLSASHLGGAKKVVSLLSTCVYPDAPYITYPLTEEQLHLGPPHSSNYGYAYAKRMVDVMSRAYRQQYGCNFITAIPNNLYGKNDNFDLINGHIIPAIIRKVWEAKINNKQFVECWGDGSALREFTYSEDIVEVLMFLLENYDEPMPINIGNTEEYAIKDIVGMICSILEYNGRIVWNTKMPSGQSRKPSSNQKLIDIGWDKRRYTSLEKGLTETCQWVKEIYPLIRGVK
jgi:GDP-L-fucose synthase